MCSAHGSQQQMLVRCRVAGVLLLPSNGWESSWAQLQEGATGSGLDHQESSHCCLARFGGVVGTIAERWDARAESTQQACFRTLECQGWSECKCYSGRCDFATRGCQRKTSASTICRLGTQCFSQPRENNGFPEGT